MKARAQRPRALVPLLGVASIPLPCRETRALHAGARDFRQDRWLSPAPCHPDANSRVIVRPSRAEKPVNTRTCIATWKQNFSITKAEARDLRARSWNPMAGTWHAECNLLQPENVTGCPPPPPCHVELYVPREVMPSPPGAFARIFFVQRAHDKPSGSVRRASTAPRLSVHR